MRFSLGVFAVFIIPALADGPCDVNSDSCRAVINASACFNEFMSGGNKASILNCLAGTDGAASPKDKMCACTGCVAPVMTAWLTKNNVCT
ncbi:uncharacterized protein LY89DRAFT_732181 [Mollisia scopiformis]|uniref:Uncharacterized protein n=1 Tax=Mollisia scopiformis TaxID=149040 RepID=A0A194XEM8_MOLSC|nr:uncharacterized protein LY89DRAFT_732181 [Mollisia scopiformis]KUJ18628.1 hypothetical protein LY89DRAFT_732181 [Mollisia scopiformis]